MDEARRFERRARVEVLARAFRDNPMNRAVLRRSPARRLRANRLGATGLLAQADRAGHVLVDPNAEIGSSASANRLPRGVLIGFGPIRPDHGQLGLAQAFLLLRQGVGATRRWSQLQRVMQTVRPAEPHWTLAMIGVESTDRCQGVGTRLIARWLERVSADDHPAWVETDRPELVPFYRSFGFELAERCTVHGVEVACLLRV